MISRIINTDTLKTFDGVDKMSKNTLEVVRVEVEEEVSQESENKGLLPYEKLKDKVVACLKTWLATKSIHTQRSYKKTINDYFKNVGKRLFDVEPAFIVDWITSLKLNPSSSALKLTTIRAMYDVLIVNNLTTRNPVVAIKSNCFGKVHKKHHGAVPINEVISTIAKLEAKASSEENAQLKFKLIRDLTILRLFASLGLRCFELSCLKVEDFKPNHGFITIHGKGGKTVDFPVKGNALVCLNEWLELRESISDYIFTSLSSNSGIQKSSHLSTNGIRKIVKGYLGAEIEKNTTTGENGKKNYEYKLIGGFTPHCLRATSITECYRLSGNNLHLAQSHARHSSPVVTEQVYIMTDKLKDAEKYQPNF